MRTENLYIVVAVAIIILGSYFRLVDLGKPGFWGDEETSSIPARSLALERGPIFGSGMEYRRALPHTYLSAWSARVWGIDKDASYRIPSAVIGIATLILVFLATRPLLGFKVALVATALLAFSEWHIMLSRTARMYGPLLFFSTLFFFSALNWNFKEPKQLRHLILTSTCFAVAITFNFLAMMILPVLFIPVVFSKFEKARFVTALMATAFLGVMAYRYNTGFLSAPYLKMVLSDESFQALQLKHSAGLFDILGNLNLGMQDVLLVLLGLAVGLTLYATLIRKLSFSHYPLPMICLFLVTLAYGLLAFYGAVYGALICILFLFVFLTSMTELPMRSYLKLLVVLLTLPCLITLFNLYKYGFTTGLKASLSYPFPYLLYQFLNFPGVIILFLIGILASIVHQPTGRQSTIIKILTVTVLTPPAVFGLFSDWAPPRFFVTIYPPLIIVASYGLVTITEKIKLIHDSRSLSLAILVAIPVLGVLGGHGVPQANAVSPNNYGSSFYGNHVLGIKYPDHRSHGCFVQQHLQQGDIIVAEDALQIFWYTERVDYWLRPPSNIGRFLYDDGNEVKDIYVNSKPTSDEVIDELRRNSSDRIWVITSGETQQHLDHFLHQGSEQRKWLDEITNTHNPLLIGRDQLSATYCINCDIGNIDPDSIDIDCGA